MGAGQVSDFGGFSAILATYDVATGRAADVLAAVIIAAEVAAGVALLTSRYRVPGAVLGLAVTVAWTVLAAQAFARGLAVPNCGCFGVYFGQELRWWVLLEDAEFILLAAWVLRGARTYPIPPQPVPRGLAARG
jgi:hypothetical protein